MKDRNQSACARNSATSISQRKLTRAAVSTFEALESRQLMSNTVTLNSGILTLTGSPTAGSSLTVELVQNGADIDGDAGAGTTLVVPASSVKGIKITGGSAGDYIFIDNRILVPATISSGNGNDNIRGGGGKNIITAGTGNVSINGRGTSDSIVAGNGNDTISGGVGPDTITVGNGNDLVDGGAGDDVMTLGNGNDTITADSGNDTVVAGNGKDSINGSLGNDHLTVGTGLSTIVPGSSVNYITIGNKADKIVGSTGTNTIVYSNPTDPQGSPAQTVASSTQITFAGATWAQYSAAAASGTNPVAVMDVLNSPMTAGIGIDVRGLGSYLGTGTAINANYQWNFGDPNGENNVLPGYNATHIYNMAGTYTVSLTVTNDAGQTSTVGAKLVISPDARRAIYVNALSGNDSFGGQTPAVAVQSLARAQQLMGNNTELFLDRGQAFNLTQAFKLTYTNVLVGAYGSGAQPIINYTDPVEGSVDFTTNSSAANGVTIEDLTMTALNAAGNGLSSANPPMGVNAGGFDTTVLRCTFANVEYAINGNSAPTGLNVIDNTTSNATSVQGYFVWDQGIDTTVMGNTTLGSVHEHIMRTSSAQEILAYDNNFTNNDGKGCIEIHEGAYAWIDSNIVNGGDIRVGPLGLWGEAATSSTDDCVIQNNLLNGTFVNVYAGAHSISIRNNIIRENSGRMIDVRGQDSAGRQSSDIEILNNTGISTGSTGNFLQVESHVNGILLENNLLVEPNLIVGGYGSAPVYIDESNLSSFTYVNGNVWQLPANSQTFSEGGINYVGTFYTATGYLTPTQWNAESQVGTDYFYNVVIDPNTGAPAVGSPVDTAGSAVAGVFSDIDGQARPTNGAWTAGAVQV